MNGVRDRLRVLLVSGQPYPGLRVWRNLLKADPSVDLVHFTILRPPEIVAAGPCAAAVGSTVAQARPLTRRGAA